MNFFDLNIFKRPGSQMKMFLGSSQIVNQELPREIASLLDGLKKTNNTNTPKSIFYSLFFQAMPKLFFSVIFLNIWGKLVFLLGFWVSENLLKENNSLYIYIVFGALFALSKVLRIITNYISCLYGERVSSAIGLFFFYHINQKFLTINLLNLGGNRFSSGNLKVLITSDIGNIQRFFNGLISSIIPALTTIIVLGPFLWQKMGVAGLSALIASFVLIPLILGIVKIINTFQKSIQRQEDELTSIVGEWVNNVRLVRYLSLNSAMSKSIQTAVQKLVLLCCKQHSVVIVSDTLAMVWWIIPIILLCLIANSIELSYSPATLFGSIWILNQLNSEIKFIPFSIRNYASAKASLDRIKSFWSLPNMSDKFLPPVGIDINEFNPVKVHFKNVSIKLGSILAFSGFSASFDLREKTFIIGPVGGGKSILLRAIIGDIAPDKGDVYIELENGIIHNLWHKDVHKMFQFYFGYVPQSSYLSNDTLKNNISLDSQPDISRVMDAIHFSQMLPDIESFPSGINEEIGEQGINLSGGQKQRISIARAFYMNREFLIMDDPFSSLDNNTEVLFFNELMTHFKSFIISTHRLSNMNRVDRVLLLEDGQIMEDGHPDDLLSSEDTRLSQYLESSE